VGADSSYCRKIRKEEGLVRFVNAKELYDQFRAYKVWPGIFLRSELKLKELTLLSETGEYRMGEILAIDKEGIVVGCKEGSLRIFVVQAPSKKEVDAVSYVNGKRLGVGDILF
jgi:methionyl-tRNA formyltransferase